jgi:hypothetical protein
MVELDLFIQDFVTTNKLMNQHCSWATLSSRRFHEDGLKKVFSFESGGKKQFAVGQHLALPDGDWFRIELTHSIPVGEHRLDCLRMMRTDTHVELEMEEVTKDLLLVKLTTRHRGLINIVFVIRDGLSIENPFLTS